MTSLDTVTVAGREIRPTIELACPHDGTSLYWDETGGTCPRCGALCDRIGDIPVFGRVSGASDTISDEDQGVLEEAYCLGWERALRKRLSAEELDPSRADWRFLLPLTERSRVLEIGTVWGTIASEIAAEVQVVAASTPNSAYARFLEMRAQQDGLDNLVPVVAPADVSPFANGAFDLVVLNGGLDRLLGLLPARARRLKHLRFLRKVAERLAPGGRLCFGATNRYGVDRLSRPWESLTRLLTPASEEGVSSYGLDGLRKLLKESGFGSIDVYATIPSFRHPRKLLPLGEPAVCDLFIGKAMRETSQANLRQALARTAFRSGVLARLVPQFCVMARRRG